MDNQVDKELEPFCRNVYELRKYYGLTQREMAAKLGIGVGSLRMIEHGKIPERMTCEPIFKLSLEFGIPIRNLFFYPLELPPSSATGEEKRMKSTENGMNPQNSFDNKADL